MVRSLFAVFKPYFFSTQKHHTPSIWRTESACARVSSLSRQPVKTPRNWNQRSMLFFFAASGGQCAAHFLNSEIFALFAFNRDVEPDLIERIRFDPIVRERI